MMKYKIYFADLTHTGIGINASTFPLGIGFVVAYAAKELKDEIEFALYRFPEDLNRALMSQNPHILCLSNYAWNSNLAYSFASFAKKIHPKVIVIFGGPNFPLDHQGRKDFLKDRPAIDFYIKWDGEHAFVNLVRKLIEYNVYVDALKKKLIASENVCYMTGDNYIEGPDQRVNDLMTIPSPYVTGLFEPFFHYPLMPIIETTRGCPYSCTYCNDGNSIRNSIFRRSYDYINEELGYIASRIKYSSKLIIADLNFGIYKEDIITSHIIRSIIDKYNWPVSIDTSIGKSNPTCVLKVINNINKGNNGIIKLAQSFQSTDSDVLRNIKRKNLSIVALLSIVDYISQIENEKLEFYTELILPLPGDTVEKHYRSLQDVIDTLYMNNIDIHQLTLLKGSHLATVQERLKFRLNTRYRVPVGCFGIYDIGDEYVPCAEIEEIVVGNRSLSFDEYIECRIMDLLVKIYIDHDRYKEIFGLIRKLNRSSFKLLCLLKDNFLPNCKPLSNLIKCFVDDTKKALFGSYDEILEFVTNIENIEKYISGEYGKNELLTYRALAYTEYSDYFDSMLKDATLFYLESANLLDNDIHRYINEALEFSKLRRFDPRCIRDTKKGEFTFSFIEAEKFSYEIAPDEFKTNKTKYEFFYEENDLLIIEDLIDSWGTDTLQKIGKFFQNSNLLLMDRRVRMVL